MNRIISLTSLVVLLAFSFDLAQANDCSFLFNLSERKTSDPILDYNNDQSYVESFKSTQSMGIMASVFDSDLDTRIYYGQTGLPNLSTGELPMVDPRAKGLFIFLHGSGTMGATGKNFNALMNGIHEQGLAGLSFDLPYHADGPVNESFNYPTYFMRWLKKAIDKYRVPGMPVYLIGHSYGSDLIPEFMYRFPNAVDGGLSISLVGFNSVLKDWYLNKTKKMNFDGVVTNSAGDLWADSVAEKFLWRENGLKSHNFRVLVGDHEEYVPGPIRGKNGKPTGPNTYDYKGALLKLAPDAIVTVEKGVGHYIFDHRDENGRNAIMREILLTAGLDPSQLDQKPNGATNSIYPNTDAALQKYASDPFFRAWVSVEYRAPYAFFQKMRKHDERVSKSVLQKYEASKKQREAHLKL